MKKSFLDPILSLLQNIFSRLLFFLQIILEFSRIMEKDMNEAIMDSWNNFVPKILDMCTDSDSPGLQHFLDLYSLDEVSDGKWSRENLYR